ncbi:MAG: endopeptidase La, partial [Deltaproteobacteria bacterium]|nr:endopeptidase La [Deltaproteobacteria bacterium]
TITCGNLHRYLGPPKFIPELDQASNEVGVATGLAWTQTGGEVLYVEASVMKGKGELTLTGQLGEVMQESAKAALTFVRSNATVLGIEKSFNEDFDLHIHVPAGAIPKDGPSAGITMAIALVSAFSGQPVNRDVAMTGEITLRGRVLPVGGLKEKALAAQRAGIKKIIIPAKNKKDLAEIPRNIKRKLTFLPVSHVSEALHIALEEQPETVDGQDSH